MRAAHGAFSVSGAHCPLVSPRVHLGAGVPEVTLRRAQHPPTGIIGSAPPALRHTQPPMCLGNKLKPRPTPTVTRSGPEAQTGPCHVAIGPQGMTEAMPEKSPFVRSSCFPASLQPPARMPRELPSSPSKLDPARRTMHRKRCNPPHVLHRSARLMNSRQAWASRLQPARRHNDIHRD